MLWALEIAWDEESLQPLRNFREWCYELVLGVVSAPMFVYYKVVQEFANLPLRRALHAYRIFAEGVTACVGRSELLGSAAKAAAFVVVVVA